MQIKKVLFATTVTVLLYFSTFFVFWSPLPLLFLSLDKEKGPWWSTLILSFLIVSLFYLFLFPPFGFFYLLFYLSAALFLSLGVWKKWRLLPWGLKSGVGITLSLLALGVFLQVTGILDVWQILHTSLEEAAATLEEVLKKPEFLHERRAMLPFVARMKEMIFFFPKLLPAFLFIFSIFVLSLNVVILRAFHFKRSELTWMGRFPFLHLPHFSIWFLLIPAGLFFLNDYFFRQEWLQILSLNLVLMAGFAYFVQGTSIAVFFLRRFSFLFRLLIYGLVFLFLQILGLVVVGLGVADVWLDFRKLNKVKS